MGWVTRVLSLFFVAVLGASLLGASAYADGEGDKKEPKPSPEASPSPDASASPSPDAAEAKPSPQPVALSDQYPASVLNRLDSDVLKRLTNGTATQKDFAKLREAKAEDARPTGKKVPPPDSFAAKPDPFSGKVIVPKPGKAESVASGIDKFPGKDPIVPGKGGFDPSGGQFAGKPLKDKELASDAGATAAAPPPKKIPSVDGNSGAANIPDTATAAAPAPFKPSHNDGTGNQTAGNSTYTAAPDFTARGGGNAVSRPDAPLPSGVVAAGRGAPEPRPDVTRANVASTVERIAVAQRIPADQVARAVADVTSTASASLGLAPAPPTPGGSATLALRGSSSAPAPSLPANFASSNAVAVAAPAPASARGAAEEATRRTGQNVGQIDDLLARETSRVPNAVAAAVPNAAPVPAVAAVASAANISTPGVGGTMVRRAVASDDVALVRPTLADMLVSQTVASSGLGPLTNPTSRTVSTEARGIVAALAGDAPSHRATLDGRGVGADLTKGGEARGSSTIEASGERRALFAAIHSGRAEKISENRGIVARGGDAIWRVFTGRAGIPAAAATGSGWAFSLLLAALFARKRRDQPKKKGLTVSARSFGRGVAFAGIGAMALITALLGAKRTPAGARLIVLMKEVPRYISIEAPAAPLATPAALAEEVAPARSRALYLARASGTSDRETAVVENFASSEDSAPKIDAVPAKKIPVRVSQYLERLVAAWKTRHVDAPTAESSVASAASSSTSPARVGTRPAMIAAGTAPEAVKAVAYESAGFLSDEVISGVGWGLAALVVVLMFRRRKKVA